MNKEYRKKLFDILDQIDELSGFSDDNRSGEVPEKQSVIQQNCEEQEKFTGPNRDHTKRYSSDFKKMIVRLHTEEKRTYGSLTQEYGVSKATITKWCSDFRYENHAKLGQTEKELENTKAEYQKLKEENAFLKRVLIMLFGKEMEELA